MKIRHYIHHPGRWIKDTIDDLKLNKEKFAKDLNITVDELNNVINGARDIDHNLAIALHRWFGTSTALWVNLQNTYNCDLLMI